MIGIGGSSQPVVNINLPDNLNLEEIKEIIEFAHNQEIKTTVKKAAALAAAIPITIAAQWQAENFHVTPPILHLLLERVQQVGDMATKVTTASNDALAAAKDPRNWWEFTSLGMAYKTFKGWN